MAFIMAVGFATSRTSALSSTETIAARVQPAPRMQQMGIGLGYDSLLSRISTGICDNATQAHRLELGRFGHRAEVECQLGQTLSDLKARMARKTAVRTLPAGADDRVELYYKAS
jgi:hypothetical protein